MPQRSACSRRTAWLCHALQIALWMGGAAPLPTNQGCHRILRLAMVVLITGLHGVSVQVAACSGGGPDEASGRIPARSGQQRILIEVDEPPAGPTMRGLGKDRSALVEEADKTFEDATAAVTPAAVT